MIAPTVKIRRPRVDLPGFEANTLDRFAELIARGETLEPLPTAVAHPCDSSSLIAAVEAAKARFIVPILIGPKARIQAIAAAEELDIRDFTLVDIPRSHAAADKAVELARAGEVELIMKGSLHTDELLAAVVRSATGLRTERRLSHAFIMDVPTYSELLIVTDAAINIFPTLDDKRTSAGRHRPRPQSWHRLAQGGDPVGGRDGAYPGSLHCRSVRLFQNRPYAARSPARSFVVGPLAMDDAISKEAARHQGRPLTRCRRT